MQLLWAEALSDLPYYAFIVILFVWFACKTVIDIVHLSTPQVSWILQCDVRLHDGSLIALFNFCIIYTCIYYIIVHLRIPCTATSIEYSFS